MNNEFEFKCDVCGTPLIGIHLIFSFLYILTYILKNINIYKLLNIYIIYEINRCYRTFSEIA